MLIFDNVYTAPANTDAVDENGFQPNPITNDDDQPMVADNTVFDHDDAIDDYEEVGLPEMEPGEYYIKNMRSETTYNIEF